VSSNNAPNSNPWNSPYYSKPSIAMFNNAQKENDPNEQPPNPTTDPNAEEENTVKFCLVAMGQMTPTAIVSVTGGSTPSITSVLSPVDSLNGNLSAFTLTRTAAGEVWVELTTSGSSPPFIGQPSATINAQLGAHNYAIGAIYGTGPAFSNPAVLVTTTEDGALSDQSFSVTFR
jgi:hypothetical protein